MTQTRQRISWEHTQVYFMFLNDIARRNRNFPENCMLIFKGQEKNIHRAGSLLPLSETNHKFLQIYYMGTSDEQIYQRRRSSTNINRQVVAEIPSSFIQQKELVRLFTTAFERMPADNYGVVITADNTPANKRKRHLNVLTTMKWR